MPRAASEVWWQPGEAEPNTHEVLFFALVLCMTHAGRVKDLEDWQNKVVREEF